MSSSDLSCLQTIADAGLHPRLFCLEAADRVGKTTLAGHLGPWLGDLGYEAQIFREPGGSPRAEEIRIILKHPDNGLDAAAQADLFFEAREDLLRTTLLPWLAADAARIAILDRYFWSTLVYQGFIGGQDLSELVARITRVCAGAIPVQTFLLDLDPAVAHARVQALGGVAGADIDAGDLAPLEHKARLRAAYGLLADQLPALITRVDADCSEEALTDEVGLYIVSTLRHSSNFEGDPL
jgi:dTMP kinase